MVNPAEVGNDHRDWQGNDEDTAQRADGTKDLSSNRLGYHVSISERRRQAGVRKRGHLGNNQAPLLIIHPFIHSFIHSSDSYLGACYLESPLDYKEIQLVHPKGDQSWVLIGRTDAEAESPILWPPHGKS